MRLISARVSYAMNTGLAESVDHQVLTNRLLDLLRLDDYIPSDEPQSEDLEEILAGILNFAVEKGLCDDGITAISAPFFYATSIPLVPMNPACWVGKQLIRWRICAVVHGCSQKVTAPIFLNLNWTK